MYCEGNILEIKYRSIKLLVDMQRWQSEDKYKYEKAEKLLVNKLSTYNGPFD